VVSLGKFDGVHCGHAAVLRRVREHAARLGVPAIAVSFHVQPITFFRPELASIPLCTPERKVELIGDLGIHTLVQLETGESLLQLSAENFFRLFFVEKMGVHTVVEGHNFLFGKNRGGSPALLQKLCEIHGIGLEIVPPMFADAQEISSSRLRTLIREGRIGAANALLTKPYRLTGQVVHGDHRGRTLGFPTANLDEIQTLLPKPGVYACRCPVGGKTYPAAVNIGFNPTFGQEILKIESHLIGFQGDLYGEQLHLDFHERLRDIIPFESREALIEQMNHDIRQAELTTR
jgi:riboflavin kinase/FMN adenylyltransferase